MSEKVIETMKNKMQELQGQIVARDNMIRDLRVRISELERFH